MRKGLSNEVHYLKMTKFHECNDYMEEWNFENWGIKYWSKTPEFLEYYKEHNTIEKTSVDMKYSEV